MARYIDADKLCKELTDMARYQDPYKQSTILGVVGTIKNTRTADVAPRAEVAREIFEEIEKYMMDSCDVTHTAYKTIGTTTFAILKKKYTEERK